MTKKIIEVTTATIEEGYDEPDFAPILRVTMTSQTRVNGEVLEEHQTRLVRPNPGYPAEDYLRALVLAHVAFGDLMPAPYSVEGWGNDIAAKSTLDVVELCKRYYPAIQSDSELYPFVREVFLDFPFKSVPEWAESCKKMEEFRKLYKAKHQSN